MSVFKLPEPITKPKNLKYIWNKLFISNEKKVNGIRSQITKFQQIMLIHIFPPSENILIIKTFYSAE